MRPIDGCDHDVLCSEKGTRRAKRPSQRDTAFANSYELWMGLAQSPRCLQPLTYRIIARAMTPPARAVGNALQSKDEIVVPLPRSCDRAANAA